MPETTFTISIPNLQALLSALQTAPEISKPRFADAFLDSKAALINNTKNNTPYKTGFLGNPANWKGVLTPMSFAWSPNANYAGYVEEGTAMHGIWPKNKKALHWGGKGGPVVAYVLNHPGTKPNPFMERIRDAANPEIQTAWTKALQLITLDIANKSNG